MLPQGERHKIGVRLSERASKRTRENLSESFHCTNISRTAPQKIKNRFLMYMASSSYVQHVGELRLVDHSHCLADLIDVALAITSARAFPSWRISQVWLSCKLLHASDESAQSKCAASNDVSTAVAISLDCLLVVNAAPGRLSGSR